MSVLTEDHELAVLNDTTVAGLGTITLRNATTRGQVLILAQDNVRADHVVISGLHVAAAGVRGRTDRPHGFGVDALPGGLTVWIRQPDPEVVITAEVLDVSAGSEQAPPAACPAPDSGRRAAKGLRILN